RICRLGGTTLPTRFIVKTYCAISFPNRMTGGSGRAARRLRRAETGIMRHRRASPLEASAARPDIQREPTGHVPSGADMKETDDLHFDADVIAASRGQTVLVDFWAPRCGPCRALGPVLERVEAAAGGTVRIVKINVDDNPEAATRYGVRSIPFVVAFRDGQAVDKFIGALPQAQVQAFVDKQLAR